MSINIENIKEAMIPYNSFSYWFVRDNNDDFRIYEKASGKFLRPRISHESDSIMFGAYQSYTCETSDDFPSALIMENFNIFKQSRPEFDVGVPVQYSEIDSADMVSTYERILLGSMLIRTFMMHPGKDPDSAIPRVEGIIGWLESTDFYHAPASTRFHESCDSGLLKHILNVYNESCDVWKIKKFSCIDNPGSFSFVALVHDWCKIGLYESYMRNVKDEKTGQWHQEKNYRWKDSGPSFSFGHGVSSMFLASRFTALTPDEAAAIRWHMGAWNVASNEHTDLQTSNEIYPLVHLVQFADSLSIVRY